MSNSGSDGENEWDSEEERARRKEEQRERWEEEKERSHVWQEDLRVVEDYLNEIRRDRDRRLAQGQEYPNANYYKKVVDHFRYITEDLNMVISEDNQDLNFESLVTSLQQQEEDHFKFPLNIVSRVAYEIIHGKSHTIDYGFQSTDEEEEAPEDDEEEEAPEDDEEEEAPEDDEEDEPGKGSENE